MELGYHPRHELGLDVLKDIFGIELGNFGPAIGFGVGGAGTLLLTPIFPNSVRPYTTIAGIGMLGLSVWNLIDALSESKKPPFTGNEVPDPNIPQLTIEEAPKVDVLINSPKKGEVYYFTPWDDDIDVEGKIANYSGEAVRVRLIFEVSYWDESPVVTSYELTLQPREERELDLEAKIAKRNAANTLWIKYVVLYGDKQTEYLVKSVSFQAEDIVWVPGVSGWLP